MYAIKYKTAECLSSNGHIVTYDGETNWVTEEPEGWVEATSHGSGSNVVPNDVYKFKSEEAAHKFFERWLTSYHPWYGKPNGYYEVVKLAPKYKKVVEGYDIVQND